MRLATRWNPQTRTLEEIPLECAVSWCIRAGLETVLVDGTPVPVCAWHASHLERP